MGNPLLPCPKIEEDAGGGCENWKCSFSAGKIWMDGCSE